MRNQIFIEKCVFVALFFAIMCAGTCAYAQVPPPRSLSAKWNCETYGGVKLTWDYPEGLVKSKFKVFCDGKFLATTEENEISYTHQKPVGGTHKYEVRTVCGFEMSEPVAFEVSGTSCCAEPEPVAIKDLTGLDGAVQVTLADFDLYSVYFCADAPITDMSEHKNFFGDQITIDNLVNDRIYHIVVFKISSDGKEFCNFLMTGNVINPQKVGD